MKNIGMFAKYTIVLLLIIFLVSSCKNENSVRNTENVDLEEMEEEVVTLEADFVEFYEKFHTDSLFQLDHVSFPLKDHESDIVGKHWHREDWVMHHPFSNDGNMFKRDYTVLGKVVIEKIIDANGYFKMERRFAELSDGWNLIYYKVEHPNLEE